MRRLRRKKKTDKRATFLIVVLALIICIACPAILASVWIYSNVVNVSMEEFELTLSVADATVIKFQYADFTALLTLNGAPQNGKTVHLLFANKTSTGISAVTNSTGHAFLQWNVTAPASFVASYLSGS